MDATFLLNADELDEQFLQGLKQTFAHRQIEIVVRESDETAYLLRSSANRQHLQEAVADVEAGRNVVTPESFP
ncbi:MAG TPA: hypothetical protein VF585_10395 [Chthoniobacterales bacterium]|jgi:antitoxin YefM